MSVARRFTRSLYSAPPRLQRGVPCQSLAATNSSSLGGYLKFISLKAMLTHIHPKLPMRDKTATRDFYVHKLDFEEIGSADFDGYLMLKKDNIEIHFFEFKD